MNKKLFSFDDLFRFKKVSDSDFYFDDLIVNIIVNFIASENDKNWISEFKLISKPSNDYFYISESNKLGDSTFVVIYNQ